MGALTQSHACSNQVRYRLGPLRYNNTDNGIARSDALIADDTHNKVHVTFWGESARMMHEGLEKRSVSVGPLKVVRVIVEFIARCDRTQTPAKFNVTQCKLSLSSVPRTAVHAAKGTGHMYTVTQIHQQQKSKSSKCLRAGAHRVRVQQPRVRTHTPYSRYESHTDLAQDFNEAASDSDNDEG